MLRRRSPEGILILTVLLAGAVGLPRLSAEDRPAAAAPQSPGLQAAELPPAEFERLHAALRPRGERWTEIAWETDLHRARRRAAREKKPLLLWVMDGHPLGCT